MRPTLGLGLALGVLTARGIHMGDSYDDAASHAVPTASFLTPNELARDTQTHSFAMASKPTPKTSSLLRTCPSWCSEWHCNREVWCAGGDKPDSCKDCIHQCPEWCGTWQCNGEAWCQAGEHPESCRKCFNDCPSWCDTWTCTEVWCQGGSARPEPCTACCPSWCLTWSCEEVWCMSTNQLEAQLPDACMPCSPESSHVSKLLPESSLQKSQPDSMATAAAFAAAATAAARANTQSPARQPDTMLIRFSSHLEAPANRLTYI